MRCGVPPERMSLSGTRVDAGLSGVKISLLDAMGMDVLSGLAGVVLAVIGAGLCGGGGVALVSTGPAGLIAGAAAGVLLAIVGRPGMEKALRKARIPLLARRLVTDNAVKKGLSRQREGMEQAVIRALADPATDFPLGSAQPGRHTGHSARTDGQECRNVHLRLITQKQGKHGACPVHPEGTVL